ncbi:hypothetical protein GLYMA_20G190700v4 [Glycine max]|uniref:F-box domain-containing protein n=1 Tax=Glycine max TaxID=3847 RepID=A0A0R0EEA9_SOYBN|nr:hypothetical protein GYH30_056354 [Glycine max]KRG92096.1 hypothetical protein GLYMA_20G190700v4 [Glycine max]
MSGNVFFPDEILVEIFRRLPSKSIVRCSAVCKLWRSLVTNESFISLHHRRRDPFLTLRLPSFPDHEFPVVAFCNACITEISFALPTVNNACPLSFAIQVFDDINCDYKVIRISCIVDDESFGLSAPLFELYPLATGSWRILDSIAPVCYVAGDAPDGFEDGLVHWVAKRYVTGAWYYFVLSFRLEDEMFGEVMLPESLAHVS